MNPITPSKENLPKESWLIFLTMVRIIIKGKNKKLILMKNNYKVRKKGIKLRLMEKGTKCLS